MRTHRRLWAVLLWAGGASGGVAAADATIERERITAERLAVEARFADEEAACRQRFFVNDCLDRVRSRQRTALTGLRERELALDDAERRQRASERQQTLERKRAETAAVAASPPAQTPASASASASAMGTIAAASDLPASSPVVSPAGERTAAQPLQAASATSAAVRPTAQDRRDPDAARDAARRASAAEARRVEGEAERARIAAREAERAARGKPANPLPIPAEVAGSAPTP